MEDMDKKQANAVEQVFDLDYNIDQAFYSHTIPKAVILFTGEALNNSMDFEPEDGEGDYDDKGGDNNGGWKGWG